MKGLMGLLNVFDSNSYAGDSLFGSAASGGAVPLIIILAVIGGSYINSMTGRTRYVDLAVSVSSMLIGAFVATWLVGPVRLPIDSDALAAAIVGLAGMTVTGLMLVFSYHRSSF